MAHDDRWKEVRDGFDKWLKLCCYLGGVWILLDLLRVLPPHIADRIIEAILGKLGI